MSRPATRSETRPNACFDQKRYAARRLLLIEQDKWEPLVSPRPALQHLRKVQRKTGMSDSQLLKAARISWHTLQRVRRGEQIKPKTARRILAVPVTTEPPAGYVDATGTRRRLQALAVIGWSPLLLSSRIKADATELVRIRGGKRALVHAATARQARRVCTELWNTPPPARTRHQRAAVTRTKNLAAREGWVTYAAWNDDQIDNPAARPVGARPPGDSPAPGEGRAS